MEDVFGDIPDEGTELIEEVETETLPTTPVEEEPVVEEPAEEGDNTPTEEDNDYKERTSKRMKEVLKERALERERVAELERQVQELTQRNLPQSEEVIPERWLELFSSGDAEQDQASYKSWKTLNEEEKANWKKEVLEELRGEEAREAQAHEEQTALYNEQMDELEETLGKKFDRNELMKAMAERPVWLTDGQPDWETKLELIEAKKSKPNTEARKKLAEIKPQGSVNSKGYYTPEDLKGGWSF